MLQPYQVQLKKILTLGCKTTCLCLGTRTAQLDSGKHCGLGRNIIYTTTNTNVSILYT